MNKPKPTRLSLSRSWLAWLTLFIVAASLYLLGTLIRTPSSPPTLSQLSLPHLEGYSVAFNDFETPLVVNLWATWCGPCRRELPMMHDMAAQNPDITFVFVSQGESTAKVNKYLLDNKLELSHVLLDKKGVLAHRFQSRGLPTTLFFDTSGNLVEAHLGELSSVQLFNSVMALKN